MADDRARLARLEPGGAPERPIDVSSASLVEVHARSLPCTRCGAEVRVEAHDAPVVDGRALRVAKTVCPMCGARRAVWFRIVQSSVN
jgi:DNA-directed RNA polymerase subunit RPC12/RpoP